MDQEISSSFQKSHRKTVSKEVMEIKLLTHLYSKKTYFARKSVKDEYFCFAKKEIEKKIYFT